MTVTTDPGFANTLKAGTLYNFISLNTFSNILHF